MTAGTSIASRRREAAISLYCRLHHSNEIFCAVTSQPRYASDLTHVIRRATQREEVSVQSLLSTMTYDIGAPSSPFSNTVLDCLTKPLPWIPDSTSYTVRQESNGPASLP